MRSVRRRHRFSVAAPRARSPLPFYARPGDTVAASSRHKPARLAREIPSSQSSAPVMPRSQYYNFVDVIDSFDLLRYAQFRASRSGVRALFFLARLHGFWRDKRKVAIGIAPRLGPFRSVEPLLAMIAKKVFHDPVLERMESDHRDASAAIESRS